MKKFNVVILAHTNNNKLSATHLIHGKPMLNWVVQAFHKSSFVDNIVVVGPSSLDKLTCMRFVKKRINSTSNQVINLINGIGFVKNFIPKNENTQEGYIISFANAVFLNQEIIDKTLEEIQKTCADFVLNLVEKQSCNAIKKEFNYIPIDDKEYAGSRIYYFRSLRQTKFILPKLLELAKIVNKPEKALEVLGCLGMSLNNIEKKLSKKSKSKIKILISQFCELSFGLEFKEELALTESFLEKLSRNNFKKIKLIYNPNAGKDIPFENIFKKSLGIKQRKFDQLKNVEKYIDRILQYLKEFGIENIEVVKTQRAQHATEIARMSVQENNDLVIAVGGDGTINEVANGLAGSECALGVIPMGTANIYGLQMNIPSEIKNACEVIAYGDIKKIDLGKVGDKYFVCMAGVGFDAHIIKVADSKLKKIIGGLAYPIVTISSFFTYPFKKIKIKIDDQPILRSGYFVVVSNSKYYAGDMIIAPSAKVDDGYLDVAILKHRNLFSLIQYLMFLRFGKIENCLSFEYFHAKKIAIVDKRPHSLHIDAEYIGETPAEIQVVPGKLKIIN